jgi:uncharacterized metal-binding protein YceD (DUF177 family)
MRAGCHKLTDVNKRDLVLLQALGQAKVVQERQRSLDDFRLPHAHAEDFRANNVARGVHVHLPAAHACARCVRPMPFSCHIPRALV